MANSSLNLINLDFNGLKDSLKSYLKSQAKFQDYDFDGSNLSVLLDVLTYNTYLNSFYLNMVASEMFLDTAQLRDSVVSHAKELNYLPRSFRSSQAKIDVAITPSVNTSIVTIPAKTNFTAKLGANTYNFVTKDSYSINTSNNNVFVANDVIVYEGSYVTDTFVKDDSVVRQRFVLNNQNIDTTSIELTIIENSGLDVYTFTQAYSLFGLTSNSNVFFVQPAENEKYEIVFGDNIAGRTPKNGALIEAVYRTCNGELPNGADTFINNSSIDGHANVSLTTVESAVNGSVSESVESIKFNAPRSFQTQERAITTNDYKVLLQREFPEIQAITVFGGENVDPPQYGKVYIAIDISNADGIPELNKTIYKNYLQNKTPLSIETEFISPSFMYLDIESTIRYNYNITTLSANDIKTKVLNQISVYNDTYLNDFDVEFRYSNFVAFLDQADSSIINNDTTVNPYVLLSPTTGLTNSFRESFNSPVIITTPSTLSHLNFDQRGLYSSNFTFNGLACQFEDDGIGNVRIVNITPDSHIEIKKVGKINYTTGEVSINDVIIDAYEGPGIKLYAILDTKDVFVTQKNILKINIGDVRINMAAIRK